MGYHPMVKRNTDPHRAGPVRMEKYLNKNPREYGMIPTAEMIKLQK